mgnify:CR=1 FL=1
MLERIFNDIVIVLNMDYYLLGAKGKMLATGSFYPRVTDQCTTICPKRSGLNHAVIAFNVWFTSQVWDISSNIGAIDLSLGEIVAFSTSESSPFVLLDSPAFIFKNKAFFIDVAVRHRATYLSSMIQCIDSG